MAGERDAGVDPRFDPVFQRGYDPQKHRTRLPKRPPLAEERAEGTRLEALRVQPATPVTLDPAHEAPEDADEPTPRRNPFRLILLLASIAAIAGAGLLLWKRIDTDPYGGYGGYGGDTTRIFLDQLSDALLAPLLTGGMLGICLWIALGALRRRDDA